MVEPLVKELLEAGVHFGHQTHRWNPKMKRFIFGKKSGIYILDLEKTAQGLEQAREFLRSVAAQGGLILFVGTKRQAQPIIAEEAVRCGQFYVNLRWLGGLLTNFQTILKSVDRMKTLKSWRMDGTLDRLTKKEAAQKEKELVKFEKVLSGILEMNRLPKAVYVVDAKREETAVLEANRLGIPVVALVDTNTDPDPITYVIPGNDDAIRSIKLVTARLADAILEGHQAYLAGQAAAAQPEAAAPVSPPAPPEEELASAPEEVLPAVIPPLDEIVETIVPEAALKVKVDAPVPKKKRVTRVKAGEKAPDKESPRD
ncbi:MAG: 30S ribosomal protein S2 [Candidatus Omnitrophica bacterium]|nr:30S ribosomal protein S2 [Candidatus Omnitrophota bacterium]